MIVCQMTSDGDDAPDFRVVIEPTARNGLQTRSHVMADKPVTIRRARIGKKIGHLDDSDIARLNIALAFVMASWDLQVECRLKLPAVLSLPVDAAELKHA